MTVKLENVDTPLLVPMPFSRRYQLTRDMETRYTSKGMRKTIVIPKGFLTDGASIPKALWSLIGSPYLPEYITAAIVHDWCCENDWDNEEMSDLFFELLKLSNVKELTAKTMRQAVYLYKEVF
ncbi:DUF1353 domain-containing protein [Shewanella algae]|uniref:DUF1353 domain-containing protein n=1 Tax=Shewanella algae TaxID=38313 RepID=UPI0031F4CED8